MKINLPNVFLLVLPIILVLIGAGCEKENEPNSVIRDFVSSDCKPVSKSSETTQMLTKSFHIKTLNSRTLQIEHLNVYSCCDEIGITVECEILEGNRIVINEQHEMCITDCICPYDISYKIGSVSMGQTTISVNSGNIEVLNLDIILKSQTDTIIYVAN